MESVTELSPPYYEDLDMQLHSNEETINHDEKKKKHKRRRRRHKTSESEASNSNSQNHLQICFTPLASQEEETSKQEKKRRKNKGVRGPVLRPVGPQVPTAPNNSTQFIMDDHENSAMFIHFNRDDLYQQRKREEDESGSSPYPPSDWLPYNAMDFQTTYQSAREDQMMNSTRENLRKAILGLEAKSTMVSSLLAASPARLLAQLQSQLLKLQEDNTHLKSQVAKKKHHLEHCQTNLSSSSTSSSSSSSGSDSDSDSTQSSSSACSSPECDTCALQRREQQDEEKENTCPGSEEASETSDASSAEGDVVEEP